MSKKKNAAKSVEVEKIPDGEVSLKDSLHDMVEEAKTEAAREERLDDRKTILTEDKKKEKKTAKTTPKKAQAEKPKPTPKEKHITRIEAVAQSLRESPNGKKTIPDIIDGAIEIYGASGKESTDIRETTWALNMVRQTLVAFNFATAENGSITLK